MNQPETLFLSPVNKGLSWYILFAACWCIGNGILHDIFVLKERRPFDKELIRLLLDGHILIFAGLFFLLSFRGIERGELWAFYVSIAAAVFILGYCALIFKMLPSIVTILIHLIALVFLLINLKSK
jgi:hypothetical protein